MKQYFLRRSVGGDVPVKVVEGKVFTTDGQALTSDDGYFYAKFTEQELFSRATPVLVDKTGKIIGEQG